MSGGPIPSRDLDFLLWDWLRIEPLLGDHDRETIDAVLELSARLATDAFLPHYKASDREEPQIDADEDEGDLPPFDVADAPAFEPGRKLDVAMPKAPRPAADREAARPEAAPGEFVLPDLDMLTKPKPRDAVVDEAQLKANAQLLESVLANRAAGKTLLSVSSKLNDMPDPLPIHSLRHRPALRPPRWRGIPPLLLPSCSLLPASLSSRPFDHQSHQRVLSIVPF